MTIRLLLAASLCVLAGCKSASKARNTLPAFISGTPQTTTYDGSSDDLLTGGLGKSGLGGAAPTFANPAAPTAAELRKAVIYTNYRAIVDPTAAGGYGTLYGPNIDVNGADTLGEGKIAGDETIAYADDGTGKLNVALMVQVPASFDKTKPCIVSATSSGSRGVYGAIATAGEWGLKHGCAVAYTDKGTGTGAHDLQNNTVNLIDGTRADAAVAGKNSSFTANVTDADRAALPNRFAFKHAHSQQNPEKDWGANTLQAIQFAFYVINEKFGEPDNDKVHHNVTIFPGPQTIVIASSVSNGGGAALAAAEQDTGNLISGVVAGEPQVQIPANAGVVIKRAGNPVGSTGKSLYDYTSIANLYQPCAALSTEAAAAAGMNSALIFNSTVAGNRCAALAAKGLLTSTTAAAQAEEALGKLHAAGYDAESDILHGSIYALAVPPVLVTYANAYARASVKDNLCGFSLGGTASSGAPAAISATAEAQLFASSNGVPPTSGINVINNNSQGGPLRDPISTSASGQQDFNLDGAICLRELSTGADPSGAALTGALLAQAQATQAGIAQVLRNGNLRARPTILVQGRNDTLVPVNHASRAYFGFNKKVEGANSQLVYYEVNNAQHFDAFIGSPLLPGYAARYVPLHRYFIQSMDLMYAKLKSGTALPPSQVVRTVPRGTSAAGIPAITPANVPPISASPGAADSITFDGSVLIPD